MKNNKGFVAILFLSVLPFLLGGFLLMYFWVGTLQAEAKIKFLCRQGQIAAQERSRKYLEQLFKMNVQAARLRVQFAAAKAAVIASGGSPGALARLEQIEFRRLTLDLTQKTLIQAANADLRISSLSLAQKLQREMQAQKKSLAVLMEIQPALLPSKIPNLAVAPDSPDIAPEYRTLPAFSEEQALEQKWQYRIRVASPLNRFLKGDAVFKKESRITLAGEDEKWRIENLRDKSWLKP